MNVNLHIERLVLDGIPLGPGQRPQLQAVVEAELARLLTADGLSPSLSGGGALASVRAGYLQLANDSHPSQLGQQIAQAVYGGIGR